jgi:hypothetical protein
MAVALCAMIAGAGCGDDEDESGNGTGGKASSTGGKASTGGATGTGGATNTGGKASAGSAGDDAGENGGASGGADDGAAGDSSTAGAEGEPTPGDEAVYLYAVAAAGDGENGSLYALLRNDIDVDISVADFAAENAREFDAYSGIAAIDGHVIVGLSNAPVAKKFAVNDAFEWSQVGSDLHFDDYFESDVDGLNFYFQAIQGKDMFLHYGADRAFRKHWDIRDWKLLEDLEETNLPVRAGWLLFSTGNRTGMRDWKGPVVQTFNMSNETSGVASDESWIAVYDEDTFEERDVIEVACPGLAQQTQDEDGNIYVSTTFNSPVMSLYGQQAASCVVRLNSDGTKDESWGDKNLADLTGGYDGVNFQYLYDGKAVANVLHHDRLEGVDWDGPVDPEVLVSIDGEWTDTGYTPQDTSLWDLELIDVDAGTSQKVTGWEDGHDEGSYMVNFKVEGRVFLAFQIDPFGDMPRNAIYELDLDDATVSLAGYVDGELSTIERVR